MPPITLPAQCLGSGEYHVVVRHRRTRAVPKGYTIGELRPLGIDWERALSAVSVATVTHANSGDQEWSRCCEVVRKIGPARAMLDIYRDDLLAWSGVARSKGYDPSTGTVTLAGSDLSVWLAWRLFYHQLTPKNIDLADIMDGYLGYLLKATMPPWGDHSLTAAPLYLDDVGLEWTVNPTGVLGTRTIAPGDLMQGDTAIGDLASTGCDWTVADTRMYIGPNEILSLTTPAVPLRIPGHITDEHFATAPQTRETADNMATEVWLRGNGVRAHVGGPDPDDGVLVQRVLDASSIEDQASADAAAQSYHDLSSKPLTYVEGSNVLSATAPIDIQTLIPGTRASLALAGGGCVPYDGFLRLDHVNVNVTPSEGEKVSVTFQPLGSSFNARGPF